MCRAPLRTSSEKKPIEADGFDLAINPIISHRADNNKEIVFGRRRSYPMAHLQRTHTRTHTCTTLAALTHSLLTPLPVHPRVLNLFNSFQFLESIKPKMITIITHFYVRRKIVVVFWGSLRKKNTVPARLGWFYSSFFSIYLQHCELVKSVGVFGVSLPLWNTASAQFLTHTTIILMLQWKTRAISRKCDGHQTQEHWRDTHLTVHPVIFFSIYKTQWIPQIMP